jgi:protein dithiol:quinone oxidoreductase
MNDVTKSFLRERVLLAILGVACLALLGGALYFQYVEHQSPCPLCILQRYAYVLIAVVALLGSRSQSWHGIRVFESLVVLCALGGVVAAARLVWVQAFPGYSCGFDALQPIVDALPPAHFLPSVFKVQGLCETVYPPIFGLGMPMWGLITYLCMLVAVLASLWYNRGRQGP